MEGLLSTGPTPSSLFSDCFVIFCSAIGSVLYVTTGKTLETGTGPYLEVFEFHVLH